MRKRRELIYVIAVTLLAVVAFHDPRNPVPWAFALSFALCLPALVVCLPILYVVAAAGWNLTGADAGGPSWPVALTYVAALTLTAGVNVALFRLRTRDREQRRWNDAWARFEASQPAPFKPGGDRS